MKIAINNEILKNSSIKSQIERLGKEGYLIELFSPNNIKDIIEYTKKNNIIIYIGLPKTLVSLVKNSPSISTSTYIINDLSDDFYEEIKKIEKNRKPCKEEIWNRKYDDEQLKSPFPKMSKSDFIRSKNIDGNLTALEYFGIKTSYEEYENDSNEYSKILETLGVKKGDSVDLCLPNTPETMKLMAAINKKGAICNNIFPLSGSEEIGFCSNLMKSKIGFVLDSKYKDLRKIIDKTNLDKVFLVTPFESLPKLKVPYDAIQKLKGFRPNDKGYGTFDDFKNMRTTSFEEPGYEPNRLSSIQYTSGTTGNPKAVLLTDDTYNARAHQYEQLNVGLEEGLRFLQCLPVCGKAYGEFTMHLGLANGANNILVPKFTSDDLVGLIKKYDIQGITMPPIAWLHVIDSPQFKKLDLSNFKLATVGGDGSIAKYIDMIQGSLQKQGFKGTVILGSGGTELGVTFSSNTKDYNEAGTSGYILKGNHCQILNENGEDVGYGERGKIYYDSVNPCIGYANNDVDLNCLGNGIDLGDNAIINENGMLTVTGRRIDEINVNGKMLSPMELEEKINKCPYIKYGYVVKSNNGKIRICFTVYEDYDDIDIFSELIKYIPDDLVDIVECFRLNNIPETPGLKVDRKRLSGNIDDLLYKKSFAKLLKRKK